MVGTRIKINNILKLVVTKTGSFIRMSFPSCLYSKTSTRSDRSVTSSTGLILSPYLKFPSQCRGRPIVVGRPDPNTGRPTKFSHWLYTTIKRVTVLSTQVLSTPVLPSPKRVIVGPQAHH